MTQSTISQQGDSGGTSSHYGGVSLESRVSFFHEQG